MSKTGSQPAGLTLRSVHDTPRHVYTIYALECTPTWSLPTFYQPRIESTIQRRDDYPLTSVPARFLHHPYCLQQQVYDAAVDAGEREYVPAWRVFADASDTVYYVGHTEDFTSRLSQHQQKSGGSNLTAECTVEGVHIIQQFPQNLQPDIVGALDDAIKSLKGGISQQDGRVKDLKALREAFKSKESVSVDVAASVASNQGVDAIQVVVDDARTVRRDQEAELARELVEVDSYTPTDSTYPRKTFNITDIESFAYWN